MCVCVQMIVPANFCFVCCFFINQSHNSLNTTVSYTHTHTHTHTHVRYCEKWGLSIGVMVFILYKLYVLLPYTYPIPKLSPHRRLYISTFPQKTSPCMIYKRLKSGDMGQCPEKSPSPCNTCHTCVIIQIYVLILSQKRTHTHTHTHSLTHSLTHSYTHTQKQTNTHTHACKHY